MVTWRFRTFYRLTVPLLVSILPILGLNLFQWNFRGVLATQDPHNQIFVWSGPPRDRRLCIHITHPQFNSTSEFPGHRLPTFSDVHVHYMLSPVRLSSVVRNVRAPYSAGWNFRQSFYAIWYHGHSLTSKKNFTEIVPGEPLRRGVKRRRRSQNIAILDFECYISETVQDRW